MGVNSASKIILSLVNFQFLSPSLVFFFFRHSLSQLFLPHSQVICTIDSCSYLLRSSFITHIFQQSITPAARSLSSFFLSPLQFLPNPLIAHSTIILITLSLVIILSRSLSLPPSLTPLFIMDPDFACEPFSVTVFQG